MKMIEGSEALFNEELSVSTIMRLTSCFALLCLFSLGGTPTRAGSIGCLTQFEVQRDNCFNNSSLDDINRCLDVAHRVYHICCRENGGCDTGLYPEEESYEVSSVTPGMCRASTLDDPQPLVSRVEGGRLSCARGRATSPVQKAANAEEITTQSSAKP